MVGVADGDTVTVLDGLHAQHRIRLAGIDAPEQAQAFGDASKRNLSRMVYGAYVRVEYAKHDRYGRIVGKIFSGGRDASLAQLRAGLAWHYKQYQREQSQEDRSAYAHAEREAQQAQSGLWLDRDPLPPWAWRQGQRAKRGNRHKPRQEVKVIQSAYQ